FHVTGVQTCALPIYLADALVDRAALAALDADVVIAALRTGAGGDQVAHAGESGERRRLAAHGDAETHELGQAARDHRRARVRTGTGRAAWREEGDIW